MYYAAIINKPLIEDSLIILINKKDINFQVNYKYKMIEIVNANYNNSNIDTNMVDDSLSYLKKYTFLDVFAQEIYTFNEFNNLKKSGVKVIDIMEYSNNIGTHPIHLFLAIPDSITKTVKVNLISVYTIDD